MVTDPTRTTAAGRRSEWLAATRPVWRRLRLVAAMVVIVWGLVLLGCLGWPEWLAGMFIAAAAFTLGALE